MSNHCINNITVEEMNYNDKQTIQTAIDESLAEVAEEQWLLLAGEVHNPRERECIAESIIASLRSLDLLSKKGMPNYDDDWVALFYLTWYQPRQINLVYSLLHGKSTSKSSFENPSLLSDVSKLGTETVCFVDWGCGCLATMFAVALAAADCYAQGQDLPKIEVYCIDSSPAMKQIGHKSWCLFRDTMQRIDRDHPVCSIFENIKPIFGSHTLEFESYNSGTDTPCVVTAIHCVYSERIRETKDELIRIVDHFKPVAVLLSTHSSKDDLLNYVVPTSADLSGYYLKSSGTEIDQQLDNGFLEKTTRWRHTTNNIVAKEIYRLSHFEIFGSSFSFGPDYSRYLTNSVNWWKNDFCFKFLKKRDTVPEVPNCPEFDDDLPF